MVGIRFVLLPFVPWITQKVTELALQFWASVLKMKMIAISFPGCFAKYCKEKLHDLIYWTCQAVSEIQRRLAVKIFIKDREKKVPPATPPWCLLLNTEKWLYLKTTSTQKIRRHFLFPVQGTQWKEESKSMPENGRAMTWTSWRDHSCWCERFSTFCA